jgi:hypothetical protein
MGTSPIYDPNASTSPEAFTVTMTENSAFAGYPILNAERTFPSDTGMVNVKTYGATGNGVTDDTAAIQAAISATVSHQFSGARILYFPAGTYLVSSPLVEKNASGTWESYLTLQGENRATTIIKLTDNNLSYQSSSTPADVIDLGSQNPLNSQNGGGNEAFDNYVFDMTIDVGKGNPGATALDFMGNNYCGIHNVTLQSSDPNHTGAVGLSMLRQYVGPCLMKNVLINGFNYGIDVTNNEYSVTFENITLLNQQLYGIYNFKNILSIRDLISTNSVPAIYNQSGAAGELITLVNAILQGGASTSSAIQNYGTLYVRNVSSTGYLSALANGSGTVPGASLTEYDSGPVETQFGGASSSLNLAVQETPQFEDTNLADWANVVSYGADPTGTNDSSAAIQAAIDSGATTVYFPTGQYLTTQTILVRGNVRMIDGFDSYLKPSGSSFDDANNPEALLQIASGSSDVTINHMQIGTPGSSHPGLILLQQNSARAVSLIDSTFHGTTLEPYTNTSQGTGTLFVEDVAGGPWQIAFPQTVFARQLDPENSVTKITNNGGTLWILGLKTENAGMNIETDNGGSTELLGGLVYPLSNIPVNQSTFVINNSQASFIYAVSSYQTPSSTGPDGDFKMQVTETQSGVTKFLQSTSLPERGYGIMMPLYTWGANTSTVISHIAKSTASSTATITWTTDEAADSQVQYGPTLPYGSSTALDSTATTTHSVLLTGLTGLTPYHFMVMSSANGTLVTSTDQMFTSGSLGLPTATGVTITGTTTLGSTLTGSYTCAGNLIMSSYLRENG